MDLTLIVSKNTFQDTLLLLDTHFLSARHVYVHMGVYTSLIRTFHFHVCENRDYKIITRQTLYVG